MIRLLQGHLQEARYFFLDLNDGFRLIELPAQFAVLALKLQLPSKRGGIGLTLLRPFLFGRLRGVERSGGALSAEAGEGGVGETDAAQVQSHLAGLSAGVGFAQDLELIGPGVPITKLGITRDDLRIGFNRRGEASEIVGLTACRLCG